MTNDEAKKALFERYPVKYNGIIYSYVSAVIYRYDPKGNLLVSAELFDKSGNSVIIAQVKDVRAVNAPL